MAGKKITAETAITQIIQDGYYKPKSPLFAIYNDGAVSLTVNGYILYPGQTYGINLDPIVATAIGMGIEVVNATQYNIVFSPVVARHSAQVVETFIKFV